MANTEGKGHQDGGYGLGWVVTPEKQDFGCCYHQSESVLHTGMFLCLHTLHLVGYLNQSPDRLVEYTMASLFQPWQVEIGEQSNLCITALY